VIINFASISVSDFALYFILFYFYLCIVNRVQTRANNACNSSFIPFPSPLGAHPRSFDPPWSRPRLRPRSLPTATGAREGAGQVSPRFPFLPPLSTLTHRICERRTTRGQATLLSRPTSSTRRRGGMQEGFPPPPSYTPAPTYAQTGTQMQDDAGRFVDKPPLLSHPPRPCADGGCEGGFTPSPLLTPTHAQGSAQGREVRPTLFSPSRPRSHSLRTRTPCAHVGETPTPATASPRPRCGKQGGGGTVDPPPLLHRRRRLSPTPW
jgi:hypothetical protein